MSPSSSTVLVSAAASLVAIGVAVYYLTGSRNGNENESPRKTPRRKSPSRKSNRMPKEQLLKVFDELKQKLVPEIQQLKQYEAAVRRQYKDLPEEEILNHLTEKWGEALGKVETSVYSANNVTEEQVKRASETFREDKEFESQIKSLRKLMKISAPGAKVPEIDDPPERLQDVDFAIQLMAELMNELVNVIEPCAKQVNPTLEKTVWQMNRDAIMAFNTLLTSKTEEMTKKVLEKYDLVSNVSVHHSLAQFSPFLYMTVI